MLIRRLVGILMLVTGASCPAVAADGVTAKQSLLSGRVDFSNGVETTDSGSSAYGSAVIAPTGTLSDDGWRVKLFGSYTTFSYSRSEEYCKTAHDAKLHGREPPGGASLLALCNALPDMTSDERQTEQGNIAPLGYTINGDEIFYAHRHKGTRYELAITPGYQMTIGALILKGYAGLGFEDNQITPADPTKTLDGGVLGGKAGLESWITLSDSFWLSADASYFTATERYGASAHLGYKPASWLTFGPEIGTFGDKEANAARAGGFLRFKVWQAETTLSGGVTGTYEADRSPYGAASVYMKF
jgi:hypothetical protein